MKKFDIKFSFRIEQDNLGSEAETDLFDPTSRSFKSIVIGIVLSILLLSTFGLLYEVWRKKRNAKISMKQSQSGTYYLFLSL